MKWQHVPYRGGAPALNDLLAGHVKTMFMSPVISLQHMQSGKLTALALAAPKRIEVLPDVPTMAEAGIPGRSLVLVRPGGTRQHAAGGAGQARKGAGRGARHAGCAQAPDRDGRDRPAAQRQAVRRLHPLRNRPNGRISISKAGVKPE